MSLELLIEGMDDAGLQLMIETAAEDACFAGGEKVANIINTYCDLEDAGKSNAKLEEAVAEIILSNFINNLPIFEAITGKSGDQIWRFSDAADKAGEATGRNKSNKGSATAMSDAGNRTSGTVSSKTNQPGRFGAAWQTLKSKYHKKGGITGMLRKAVKSAGISAKNTYNKAKAGLVGGATIAKNAAMRAGSIAKGVAKGAKAGYRAGGMKPATA